MLALCLGVGVASGFALFLNDSRTLVVAGHDARVSPTLDGYAVVETGPLLPDFRYPTGRRIGVAVQLGKTEVGSTEELAGRYAFIASQPQAQIAKVEDAVVAMAVSAALRGLGIGLVPGVVWVVLGPRRRGELARGVRTMKGVGAALLLIAVPVLIVQPWRSAEPVQGSQGEWESLATFLEGLSIPDEAADVEILNNPAALSSKRLVESALSTYDKSKEFYADAAADAADLELREPGEDETVAVLFSDRHDNIGMDPVVRAIADRAGASVALDGGDDTSTGKQWEGFSLDSLTASFDDMDRFAVAGNHDNGTFVRRTLADQGWTMLDGEAVDAPWGGLLLGVDDPRSSGLGNWRDESGLSFAEVKERLADAACDSDERISTLLVHDANLGRTALERGCVDLVLGGHTHVQNGPDEVAGENGERGYTQTNGTTGGAAYAIAIGSKPRRDAEVTLVTYRDGRPIGTQWVRLRTDGSYIVGDFTELSFD